MKGVMYILRELISNQLASKQISEKQKNGKLKTVTKSVNGPVSIVSCTTRESIYEDNSNRSILIHLDSSKEQDERVMNYDRKRAKGETNILEQREAQILLLQNLDYLLKPLTINNPYADCITLPQITDVKRRALPMLLKLIETITYFHQFQREKKVNEETGEEYIETTVEDVLKGYELFYPILLLKSDELNTATRNFYDWLKLWSKNRDNHFYAKEVREAKRITPRTLRRYLMTLREYGKIELVGGNQNKGFSYKVLPESEDLPLLLQKHLEAVKTKLKNIK